MLEEVSSSTLTAASLQRTTHCAARTSLERVGSIAQKMTQQVALQDPTVAHIVNARAFEACLARRVLQVDFVRRPVHAPCGLRHDLLEDP